MRTHYYNASLTNFTPAFFGKAGVLKGKRLAWVNWWPFKNPGFEKETGVYGDRGKKL
jgi:hypothetical protein